MNQTDTIDPKTELVTLVYNKHFDSIYQSGGHYQSYTTYFINDDLYEYLTQLNLHHPSERKDAYFYDDYCFKKRSEYTWIHHGDNKGSSTYKIEVGILYDGNNIEHKKILAKLKMLLP